MLEELKKIVKGEISSDEKELSVYSRDASIFEVKPQLVVKPKDTEDIKKLLSGLLIIKIPTKNYL